MNITLLSDSDYTKFIPLGDKVLLVLDRVDPEKMEDVGGILAPADFAARKNPMRETEVVSVGPECKQVQPGDTVLWNKLNASPFPHGDKDLYFLPESHLVCITKRGPKIKTPFGVFHKADPALVGAPDEGTS